MQLKKFFKDNYYTAIIGHFANPVKDSFNKPIFPKFRLLANSLEYPERIQRGLEWTQFLKRVFFVCLSVSKFSHFPSFNLLFLYSTVQKSVVQYRYLFGASIL